jgi:hypothetical protein
VAANDLIGINSIVDVPETLALLEAEAPQHDMSSFSAVAAIVFAENAEMMEVFVAPLETDLEHEMELSQSRVALDKKSSPDERTDASQDDAQLIDVWVGSLLFHEQSVRRDPCCFKGSPRYLALSNLQPVHYYRETA